MQGIGFQGGEVTEYIEKQIIRISEEEFKNFRALVYDHFGINLTAQKKSLIESRFNKVLQTLNFTSFSELTREIEKDESGQLLSLLINRISTNHTYFFRELEHFVFIKNQILPEWQARGALESDKEVRLWSDGCSSGEEPYSLAMELEDYFDQHQIRAKIKILATDISLEALEKAAQGIYTKEKIKAVPPLFVQKYFDKTSEDSYKVKDSLKKLVAFKRLNLMREEFPFTKEFDLVLCRNVMIYFDQATQQQLITKFYRHIALEGFMFVGHSESLMNKSNGLFEYLCPAVYQKQR